jgi:pyrroloquinoline quinone (PQQ) biosynthesis protein C
MLPEEFEERFCDALMGAWLQMPRVGPPPHATPEQARVYHATWMKNFSFFAWNFPSWLMNAATRCPYQDVRVAVIGDCVDEEVGDSEADDLSHIELLYREVEALGMPREEVFAAEPTGPILTALHAFDNLSRTLTWLGSFAAVAALEIAQSQRGLKAREQMTTSKETEAYQESFGGRAFHEQLGLPAESLVFLAHHGYKDMAHGGGELALIAKYAYTKELQNEAIWAAKASAKVLGVMHTEMVKLAHQAAGLEIDPRFMTQL